MCFTLLAALALIRDDSCKVEVKELEKRLERLGELSETLIRNGVIQFLTKHCVNNN